MVGPCSEIISAVNGALRHSNHTLGTDDAPPTHAVLHGRLRNQWWLGPLDDCRYFVRERNEDLIAQAREYCIEAPWPASARLSPSYSQE